MTSVCGRTSMIESPRTSLVVHRAASGAIAKTHRRAANGDKERRAIDLVFAALSRQSDIECRVGSSLQELFAAFHLVYQQYQQSGLMKPNPRQMRITPYHLLPTTEVLVALDRGTLTCTMSVVGDGEMGLPMESVYHEEIASLRLHEFSLAEVSCLAEKHDTSDSTQSAVFQLMPLVAQLAYRRGADQLVIAVHPRHARFYGRFLGFDVIAEERTYGQVCGKPAVAMAMDLNGLAANHPRVHQWLFGRPFPNSVLEYRPLPADLLDEMRAVVNAHFDGASPHERGMEVLV
jgi:hypothetical protein